MTNLSIIIPTLNAEAELAQTLQTVGAGGALAVELVVSDGGSGDGSIGVALQHGANVVLGPAGRGGQLQRGAAQAAGAWFLFLHADTHLPKNWSEVVATHILGNGDRAAAFRLRFRSTSRGARIVAGWANLRSWLFGLPYGDQGLLISADLYAQVGGFADIALMEDVDMARRLRGRLCLLPATVCTNAARYEQQGWVKRGGANLVLLCRYFLGAKPSNLARRYHSDPSEN